MVPQYCSYGCAGMSAVPVTISIPDNKVGLLIWYIWISPPPYSLTVHYITLHQLPLYRKQSKIAPVKDRRSKERDKSPSPSVGTTYPSHWMIVYCKLWRVKYASMTVLKVSSAAWLHRCWQADNILFTFRCSMMALLPSVKSNCSFLIFRMISQFWSSFNTYRF